MQVAFVVPGDINMPTGGYRYDRRILLEWQKLGIPHQLFSLAGNYPFPSPQEREQALTQAPLIAAEADVIVVDGLAGGAIPEFMQALAREKPVVALVHHPLCLENGLDADTRLKLEKSESEGLAFARGVITTSPATASTVGELFNYPAHAIRTVLPGVERREISAPRKGGRIKLLCIASIIERKGHTYLIEALSRMKDLDWSLDLIGLTDVDPALFAQLKQQTGVYGLADRIHFLGSVDEDALERAYRGADVFVLPSLYEGYGMAYAEAIVRGLPVIGTTAGAIPDTVPSGCGLLVPPKDVEALSGAMRRLVGDASFRLACHRNCLAAQPDFPQWAQSAAAFAQHLKTMTQHLETLK